MAKVLLENITKKFGDVVAVDNVSMEVKDGEFVVFLGPSGCGKTTTLRLIAGLETLTSGSIYIGDTLVNDLEPVSRDTAMVFQSYALYPHMTVFDNMAFPLKMKKMPKQEREKRVKEIADMLDIGELLKRKPKELSGGQKQRVAVGRAIVREPKVFLFDEPLSNLDAKLRVQTRVELRKLHEELGVTSIYVTHDQAEAMILGDRIAVMNDGRIRQLGPPQDIYHHPTDTFVAGFIGAPPMNLIDCSITEDKTKLFLEAEGFRTAVPDELKEIAKGYIGHEVVLGIRPEDIHDRHLVPDALPTSVIKATVYATEILGSDTYVHLLCGADRFQARFPGIIQARIGDEIEVVFDPLKIHLFDKKTEKAIV